MSASNARPWVGYRAMPTLALRRRGVGEPLEERSKAPITYPCERIGAADPGAQALGRGAQQPVAETAAHALDHAQEMIQLDGQQGEMPTLTLSAQERPLEALLQQHPVREAAQLVVPGEADAVLL